MKKSKLIATLCTLVLTIACLTFGVYSAIKTSFTASGTITFNAYGLELDVKCTITGTENNNKTIYGTTFTNGTARENYTSTTGLLANVVDLSATGATFTLGELKFDELNESAENKIEVTFEFYNYSSYQVQIDGTITDAPDGVYRNNITELSYIDRVSNTTPAYGIIVFEFTPKGTAITADKELAINFNANPMTEEFTVNASTKAVTYKNIEYTYIANYEKRFGEGYNCAILSNAGDAHVPYSINGIKVRGYDVPDGTYTGVLTIKFPGSLVYCDPQCTIYEALSSVQMSLTQGWNYYLMGSYQYETFPGISDFDGGDGDQYSRGYDLY